MLIGEYQHTIDTKNRIIMPSKFREHVGDVFYITKGLDGCISAYSREEWEKFSARVTALPDSDKQARALKRQYLSYSTECEVDKQGRILISPKLKEYAGLEKDVVVVGLSSRMEIWDKERWEGYSAEDTATLEEMAENMASYGL